MHPFDVSIGKALARLVRCYAEGEREFNFRIPESARADYMSSLTYEFFGWVISICGDEDSSDSEKLKAIVDMVDRLHRGFDARII